MGRGGDRGHGNAAYPVLGVRAGFADDVGTVLRRTDYHVVAAGFGAEGILVKRDGDIDDALHRARAAAASGRPVVVNAWLDKTEFREGSISM